MRATARRARAGHRRARRSEADPGVGEEVDGPRPGDASERELEHARPVDADERRVRLQPVGGLAYGVFAIAVVAGEPLGAPEHEQMLMSIQLPDDLVVA